MATNTQASLKIIFDPGREKYSIKMGQLTTESESVTGKWARNARHGFGVCIDVNGLTYRGHWELGKRNGKGS